jgi:hypothetical protein
MMQKISLAPSLSQVIPSRIRELADVAFSMDGVLRLHFGESNMSTPGFIKEAAVQAMNKGYTFYTENAGLPSLREAIAEKYAELHQVNLNPQTEIVVTASGVQALNVTIRCVIDPGDEAIVPTGQMPLPLSAFAAEIPKKFPSCGRTSSTASILMPWKRPFLRGRGSWFMPHRQIPLAGWPSLRIKTDSWISVVVIGCGCLRMKFMSASIIRDRWHRRFCVCVPAMMR